MTTRKFSPVKKDRLFYDQFEYCIGFSLSEVNCLRILDHGSIDELVQRRKQWREIAQQRWVNHNRNHATIMSRRWHEITEKTVQDLHTLAEVLLTTPYKFKLVVSLNQGYVYTNDQLLIDQLGSLPELSCVTYTQAQVTRPKNTIALKNPKHKFRSYLKLTNLTAQQKDHLGDFLYNQREHIRVSQALQRWIDHPFTRTQDYFFIDHDTEAWLTMLGLVRPGLIRKTMHIIPAK